MTKEQFAAFLDQRQMDAEITREEEDIAKANGWVVVFGASDDLIEFRGAVSDELGASDYSEFDFTKAGLLQNKCDDEDCPYFVALKGKGQIVRAIWAPADTELSWAYETDIPHATFTILEEDEPFCRGIVFSLNDVVEK